jgi:hypothetical protein
MNIGEKLLLIFLTGYVGGALGGATTTEILTLNTIMTLSMAYYFDVHGMIWNKLKEMRNV